MSLRNKFCFTGDLIIPNEERFYKKNDKDKPNHNDKWVGHKVNFGVKADKTNSHFIELYGGTMEKKPFDIYSFSKGEGNEKGEKIKIPWQDRLKDSTLDMVADFKKITIDLTEDEEVRKELAEIRYKIIGLERKKDKSGADEEKLQKYRDELRTKGKRKEFVHEYDAVEYLKEELPNITSRIKVIGDIEYNEHKGRFFKNFTPSIITIADEDDVNGLNATYDVYFTKGCLDEKTGKDNKKIYVDGYVRSYDSSIKKETFFPQQFVIDCSKVDMQNERHVNRLNFMLKQFDVKKGVYHILWECRIYRGAERVEFTEEHLTKEQKEMVELGMADIEDYRPKDGMLGENVEEIRLSKPVLKKLNKSNDFSDGAIETPYKEKELVYETTQEENFEDIKKKNKPKEEGKNEDLDEDLDELF